MTTGRRHMRLRIKIRTLLILMALTAMALVAPREFEARRERRHLARLRDYSLRYVAIHERRYAECLDSESREAYYDSTQREWAQSGLCYGLPGFNDWEAEAKWHAKRAEEWRKTAEDSDLDEKSIRRRLILPVLIDTPRNTL